MSCPINEKVARLHAVSAEILGDLRLGRSVTRQALTARMRCTFGGGDAEGLWSLRDAHEACELALVQHLRDNWATSPLAFDAASWRKRHETLAATADLLPTHNWRSEEQVAWQQFSTPVALALTAALGLRAGSACTILEPSAGTGMLAAAAGVVSEAPDLRLNELAPQRRAMLQRLFPDTPVSGEDGARIDRHWQSLDGALLNPPFSRSGGVGADRHAAARHLVAALRTLRAGGRAVAILPEWFRPDGACGPGYAAVAREGAIVLDLLMPADIYRSHGTSVEVRVLVVERRAGPPANARRASLDEAVNLLLALPRLEKGVEAEGARPLEREPVRPIRRVRAPVLAASAVGAKTVAELPVEVLADPMPASDPVGLYVPWRLARHRIVGASAHPTPLVESMAMAAVVPPPATYRPMLPPSAVRALSDAQFETLILAGEAFSRDLGGQWSPVRRDEGLEPSADGELYARGFFLGDGTGAGKGRQVAGILLDQWMRGSRRHLWISKSAALLEDARRDWQALGGINLDVQPLEQWPLGQEISLSQGVLFTTYATLRSERPDKGSRLDQIQRWLSADGDRFAGVIVFDEAHAMANAIGGGPRNQSGSEQGIAGIRLQNRNPRAKILYVSATGATDVRNLAYATRLGLWGDGLAFPTRETFIEKISASGIAAMELVARDLKAQGLYSARALSFEGVEYDILEHRLTDGQIATYDRYAEAWQIIHQNLDAALKVSGAVDEITGEALNSQARSAALSRFESTKQRFFAQVLMTMKLPSLVRAIEGDLRDGHATVVQLVSTAEAMLDRRLSEFDMARDGDLDLDLSPREYLLDYLVNAFPVQAMEPYEGEDGRTRAKPVTDQDGTPLLCPQAIALRDALVEQIGALPAVSTALDEIIRHFGVDQVAEVTGRSRRLVTGADGKQRIERRSARANLAEAQAFMHDRKRILLFSDAGGTGRSYHADRDAPNQRRRIHYLLEPGWRADNAIQGLGRTHRTHQAQPPLFRPVTTDVKGEKRFISTIARRLDSLGALTRGQRQTGGQNLFNPADNLESEIASSALNQWFRLLFEGRLQSLSCKRFCNLSGLRLEAKDGSGMLREDLPRIQQWLNRLLAFPIGLQNAVFEEYLALLEARVHALETSGRLDRGVQTLKVSAIRTLAARTVRTDPLSGAETRLLRLEIELPRTILGFGRLVDQWARTPGFRMMRNDRSGRVAAIVPSTDLMADDGSPIRMVRLIRPGGGERASRSLIEESNWGSVDAGAFKGLWEAEASKLAAEPERRRLNMLTGLLLPIWGLIPETFVEVLRLTDGAGTTLLGRTIDDSDMDQLARNLGIDEHAIDLDGSELFELVLRSGKRTPLPGSPGIWLQASLVNGSRRVEICEYDPHALAHYKAAGCFTEIIRYRTRLFVPNGDTLDQWIAQRALRIAS